MNYSQIVWLLLLCLASAVQVKGAENKAVATEMTTAAEFTSADEAYAVGRKAGFEDGFTAGRMAGRKNTDSSAVLGSLEICQARRYSGAYSVDYDRGYNEGYEVGYKEGLEQAKRDKPGFGVGFALGFFLGIIGVVIAAVI
ncbi:MAG: hypothetical protein ABIK44_02510 [candidate division WOR-3 bacterium]